MHFLMAPPDANKAWGILRKSEGAKALLGEMSDDMSAEDLAELEPDQVESLAKSLKPIDAKKFRRAMGAPLPSSPTAASSAIAQPPHRRAGGS